MAHTAIRLGYISTSGGGGGGIVEFANLAAFPAIGQGSLVYLALDTKKIYKWSSGAYLLISPSEVTSVNTEVGEVVLDKTDIGLGNVDNTSDANKPISTATQTALNAKYDASNPAGYVDAAGAAAAAPVQSVAGKVGIVTLAKADVGLSNVDNTSDADKPISTATQTALNAKQDSLGFTPENVANKSTNTSLGTSDTLYPTQNAVKNYVDSAISAGATPDATALIKGKIRLSGDLSGTADSPTVPELANKEPTITAGTTSQYWRGDKTFQTLDKSAVGLGNVDNTSDLNKPISSATQTALNAKLDASQVGVPNGAASLDGSGKVPSTQLPSYVDDVLEYADLAAFPVTGETGIIYLALDTNKIYRWSGSAYIEISQGITDHTLLSNIGTNTHADIDSALNLIVNVNWTGDYNNGTTYTVGDGVMYNGASFRMIASIGAAGYAPPAYPGNWLQVTDYVSPNDIGLGNVDNTSDADKPVSTATQTALDDKVSRAGDTMSGSLFLEDPIDSNNNTQVSFGSITLQSDNGTEVVFGSVSGGNLYVEKSIGSEVFSAEYAADQAYILYDDGTGAVPFTPTLDEHLTTKKYVDDEVATKENAITAGTTSQYWRGDKTFQTLDKAAVGLGNVDNTSDANKPISTATQTALNAKQDSLGFTPENVANKSTTTTLGTSDTLYPTQNAVKTYVDNAVTGGATPDATTLIKGKIKLAGDLSGTADLPTVPELANKEPTITAGTTSQYWRGDKSWQTLDKTAVGLSNVDNTSDLNKPISTATQTALNGKANTAHVHALSDLTQSAATNGQVPSWNGTNWVPVTPSAGVTDHTLLTNIGVNTHAQIDTFMATTSNVYLETKEPTGFFSRTTSTLSFDNGTRNFSITPTGATFDVWVKGVKYTKTGAQTIQIPALSGNHFIYFDPTGALATTQAAGPELFIDNALISIIYWNTDTNTRTYFAEERHGMQMDGATHSYLHTVFGAQFISGLALQGFNVNGNGSLDAHAQFTSDSGTIRDEDIVVTIPAQTQIPVLFRQGLQWRKKAADAFPFIYSGTAGYTGASGRIPFNEFTGGAWQLTEIANNAFVLVHLFGTNDIENPVVAIQGTATYGNVTAARLAASSEITSLSGLPFAEFVALGSVVLESSNIYTNTPKAIVRSVNGGDYVDFRGTQLYTPAGEVTTHGLLSGLSSDDHLQYHTDARGDIRYYTKAQVDTIISSITSPGDLDDTAFSFANNQASAANVTGFAFANATVRSFKALVSVSVDATTSLFEVFEIEGIHKGSEWDYSVSSNGDVTGISFSITNAGQIQYTSPNFAGFVSGTIKFRALTTAV